MKKKKPQILKMRFADSGFYKGGVWKLDLNKYIENNRTGWEEYDEVLRKHRRRMEIIYWCVSVVFSSIVGIILGLIISKL